MEDPRGAGMSWVLWEEWGQSGTGGMGCNRESWIRGIGGDRMGDEGDRGDRREGMELGEEDKGDWRGRHGTGQDGGHRMGWGRDGDGMRELQGSCMSCGPAEGELCRGTGTGMGQEGREGMGWRGQDEDRDGTGKKGWDREDRTHWGTVQSPPASCPRTSPAHTRPRAPTEGLGRSWGLCGAGRDRGCCGDPGIGLWPLCGALCLSRWWLSGDPNPGTPAPATAGCPCPLLRAGGPGLGAPPLCRVGARPRTLPARTHAHTHTHAHTRAGTCTGPRPWGAGQGTGDPGCPRPVTPRCAPDPPAEAHAGHALPALRTLFPR